MILLKAAETELELIVVLIMMGILIFLPNLQSKAGI